MIAPGSGDSITAVELFNGIFNASLVVMLITLIASLGMTFSVRQILEPAKRIWLLIGTIVVNTLLAPLIAIGVCELLPLTAEAEIGVAIVTIAAAGPAGLMACQLAKGADLAMAVSFTIVLQLLNIIAAPLWAEVVVTGATVDPLSIVADMVVLVLAPLVVGLILRGRYPDHREGWKAGLEKISNIALFVVIAVGLGVNWKSVVTSLGSWVIVASVIIIVAYVLLGFAVGFRNRKSRPTVTMISAMRFTPIGLVVISTVLDNQGAYLTPALLFAFVDTIVPFAIAVEVGRVISRPAASNASAIPADTHRNGERHA